MRVADESTAFTDGSRRRSYTFSGIKGEKRVTALPDRSDPVYRKSPDTYATGARDFFEGLVLDRCIGKCDSPAELEQIGAKVFTLIEPRSVDTTSAGE